ncbi:filamentous hemagglutinin N-terminal domain-containing protein [Pseudomonas stutzeri]|uniref:two-partner secretion domain-containing protein n=1 Tax=Stutzerimonas stutzeri TaxID=316 RepID=UPI002109D754|nr:filamentous hemagglutinin N-terminal domain-containing protein [Stutzerimonas stutzeri]MCQ4324779.1 filamentous hemagglutinin N-terminal domain-containing protein [Stutzerimonas stutzeri]
MNNKNTRRGRRPQLPSLKPLSYAVLCVMHGLIPLNAMALDNNALPSNGQITAGSGSINQSGNVLDVNQNSQKLIATWDTFNIGRDATVNFHQPGASSVALNRVLSSDASQIFGQLNANGQVYLINPTGVLFGSSAAVNVGGLVASALDIADDDFMSGRMQFDGKGAGGAVTNRGTLRAADGGTVALLGAQVRNEGTVVAKMGSVVLGGGERITLDYHGDGLINMQVDEAAIDASVINQGLLQANGGTVIMSARASDAMLSKVVNNEGVIEATSLQQHNGRILLDGGDSGVVASSGVLDVSGRNAGERGGEVTMTGEYVGLFDDAHIDASGDAGGGTVLLGGDYQGSGPLHQATATHMSEAARVDADALGRGDGGKVILWATDSTQFHGNISVIGGGEGGKGGLVETSAHTLDVSGRVDLSAASGKGGTWLLDPYNINITSAASSGTSSDSPFTPNAGGSSTLSSATLNASLSEGANIIVQTSSGAGTSGDINVLDNVQAQGNASLSLIAHRNVNMTGTSITHADGATLNVSLLSNFNNSGNGSVALNNATIRTNGGDLTISGAVDPSGSFASTNVSSGTGVLIRSSLIDTNGGDITIRGATSATLAAGSSANAMNISASTLDAGGGDISITAVQASTSGTGDAFILHGGSSLLTEGAGSIDISADNLGSGNSTGSFGGYGILLNSTGSSQGVSITTQTGDITLRGDSVGTSDAIALGGSGTASTNRIASQGGDILLDGHFHSPDTSELDHGIALLGVTNVIQTTGNGNVTLVGRSTGSGDGVDFYSNGNNLLSVENGKLSLTGQAADANGISVLTGQTELRATGSGSISLDGYSKTANGIHFYPSSSGSSVTIASNSGDIDLSGRSDGGAEASGVFMRSGANSIALQSASGDIRVSGRGDNGASGITFNGTSSGSNSLLSGAGGNLTLEAYSRGGTALNFVSGNNSLSVQNGTLLIGADAPGGSEIAHGSDNTRIGASGSGVVVYRLGGLINSGLLGSDSEAPRAHLQQQIVGNAWSQVLYPDYRQTPLAPMIDRVDLDLSQWQAVADDD